MRLKMSRWKTVYYLDLPERINPDTGVKFQMYDERPKNPKEDGSYYPQDGKIFFKYKNSKEYTKFRQERWVTPVKSFCVECRDEFMSVAKGRKRCKIHRARKIRRTPEILKKWLKENKKPCECSIDTGKRTGCNGATKSLDEFPPFSKHFEAKFPLYCNVCAEEVRFSHWINNKYNGHISSNDYYDMIEKYGDKCQICGTKDKNRPNIEKKKGYAPAKRWNIEHQHSPYKIRGLTCFRCNWGIGNFRDDPKIMEKAIKYLQENPYKGGKPYRNSDKTYPDPIENI